jgi:hypothetical protein
MMSLSRPASAVALVLTSFALVASCAPPSVGTKPATPPLPAATAAGADAPLPTAARPARKTPATFAQRPPPPAATMAMKGEPSGKALSETRLVPTTCEAVSAEQIELRVKEMRAAVDASFKTWHDAQPGCWEQDREDFEFQREMQNSGSLGLRGHGFGGGGMGAGASGPTVRSGFSGASYGRLSGSHASRDSSPVPRAPGAAPAKAGEPARAASASGTNNQVASVDEADIVKTDGRYVYFAANGALRIAEALDPKIVSVTKVPGTVREMFVEGNRAVLYTSSGTAPKRCTYGYDCTFAGDSTQTKVLVFDITSRAQPKLVRQLELSGSLVAARRIGNAVHTVVSDGDAQAPPYATWPSGFSMCGTMEPAVRAKFAKLKLDNEAKIRASTTTFPTLRENDVTQPMCNGLLRTAIRDGQAFTSVVSFDLTADKKAATTATLQSRPGAVFASHDALYLSVVHQRQNAHGRWYTSSYANADEASEIHKFKIGASPEATRYVGSGIVPGHVLNQFAMDEWSGYLRIATTRGRVPDPKVSSAVSILTEGADGNLVRVGAVENIAPGEDIRAVRFDDDRGYVVTFKKTDPLFVLDLYQPSHPAILGELKIPGFSTYIHRIDPDHLLSIGFDANDHGSFAYFDGVILQLFDVKNPTDPRLIHKEKIGSRGSSSEAATDHLAFNYFADQGLLAVPMTICEGGGDGRNGDQLAFSGLLVYDVDLEKGFTRLGGVDHGTKGATCSAWWSSGGSTVKRSVFLDDLVYSMANDRVKVQRMSHFGVDLADLSLSEQVERR